MLNKIKISIILFQLIGVGIGSCLLVYCLISNQYILASIVALLFHILIIKACFDFFKKEKTRLMLVVQYLQILGVAIGGFYMYFHPSFFLGAAITFIDGKIGIEGNLSLPEYALLYVNDSDEFLLSINIIPVVIVYLLEKYFGNSAQQNAN